MLGRVSRQPLPGCRVRRGLTIASLSGVSGRQSLSISQPFARLSHS